MSDINLDFTVSNNSIQFTVEPNEITITPTDIQLTLGATGGAGPAGNIGQLQYKVSSLALGGVPDTLYDGSNLTLGNVANIKITGGTNGYVLQTDGTGNLDWVAQSGGGTGSPGGSNTQIQYNDGGSFGGNTGFTFNELTGNVAIPGNLTVAGNIVGTFNSNFANYAGNVTVSNQPNITSVGTLANLSVTGYIEGGNIYANSGSMYAVNLGGSLLTNAQPNITSVGTLTGLNVTGNIATDLVELKTGIENITIQNTAIGSSYNFDLINQAIVYNTANANANITLNFRGNSTVALNSMLAVGDSIVGTYIVTTGSTPYGVTAVQVDGSSRTINWAGAATPAQFANTKLSYTFTLIKTASSTYTVLGSQTRYG